MCTFSLAEHTILKIASSLGIHTDKVKLMYESLILEQETAFFLQNSKKWQKKNILQKSQDWGIGVIKSTKRSS